VYYEGWFSSDSFISKSNMANYVLTSHIFIYDIPSLCGAPGSSIVESYLLENILP
jgi:hypothetical protein